MKSLRLIIKVLIAVVLLSCGNGIKKGSELSQTDLNFIKQIGLLEDNEKVILFDSQLDNQTSGNLITDKRLASYWIDRKTEINNVNSANYSEIDSIATRDLSNSWTDASFIKVMKSDGTEFKVYVDGDAKKIGQFFETAKMELKKWKK